MSPTLSCPVPAHFGRALMPRSIRRGVLAALLLIGALSPAPARAQGVHVALLPAQQTVAPGSTFDLTIEVTQAGSAFNGFKALVQYDPAALTFVPLSPTASQQGCLMTGACSAACGNTFHDFRASHDTLQATSILLCPQFNLTGPGQIYKLRFQASNTAQITELSFLLCEFYTNGTYVLPVTTTGCRVGIGVTLDAGGGTQPAGGMRLLALPNPARGVIALDYSSGATGPTELVVTDVAGRIVRRFRLERVEPGAHRLEWDGRDDSGASLPAGVYLVRMSQGALARHTRVTLLR